MQKIRTRRSKRKKKLKRIIGSGGRGNGGNGVHVFSRTGGDRGRRRVLALSAYNLQKRIDEINDIRLSKRELGCSIYLDTYDTAKALKFFDAVKELSDSIDFEVSKEYPAIKGSWIKNFSIRSKKALKSKEVRDRLEKVERAIELQQIDKIQSEVDLNTASAISKLIESSKDIPNFCTMIGSLLFAKTTINGVTSVTAQTLSQKQLKIIKDKPSLLHQPIELMQTLEFREGTELGGAQRTLQSS